MQGILKFVGVEHWPWPHDHIHECRDKGPSIRISPKSIPDLEKPYPVAFIHPRGTFTVHAEGMDSVDLYRECQREGYGSVTDIVDEMIVEGLPTLEFIAVFMSMDRNDDPNYDRLIEKYDIRFAPAVTHYSYITCTQVVVEEDVSLLEELVAQGYDVEPVRVVRDE